MDRRAEIKDAGKRRDGEKTIDLIEGFTSGLFSPTDFATDSSRNVSPV